MMPPKRTYIDIAKVLFILLICAQLSAITLGLFFLDLENATNTVTRFIWLSILMLLPILLAGRNASTSESSKSNSISSRIPSLEFAYYIIVWSGVLLHFLLGGVPAFSNNVEISRFDFTSSGLFGIPGRLFLYGPPILLCRLHALKDKFNPFIIKRLLYSSYLFWITAQLLSGFKSGVISVLIFFIIIATTIRIRVRFTTKTILLTLGILILSILPILYFARLYSSLGLDTSLDVLVYTIDRMTTIAAAPGHLVLSNLQSQSSTFNFITDDLLYYISKYIPVLPPTNLNPLSQIVSSQLYNTTLGTNDFVVPVTIAAPAYLFASFGNTGGSLAALVIGRFAAWHFNRARTHSNENKRAISLIFIYYFSIFLTNGEGIYLILNTTIVYCFLCFSAKVLAQLPAFKLVTERYLGNSTPKG